MFLWTQVHKSPQVTGRHPECPRPSAPSLTFCQPHSSAPSRRSSVCGGLPWTAISSVSSTFFSLVFLGPSEVVLVISLAVSLGPVSKSGG